MGTFASLFLGGSFLERHVLLSQIIDKVFMERWEIFSDDEAPDLLIILLMTLFNKPKIE